ncbi:CCA tRNA nucleotidyltransferase [Paenibacillus thermoaerophilus]|uniref:CCA tRNA nucleotidyltransferase n=1 Tax=Paenibacillus thermoaerophilus TaxID=1215385 RepID=A0ABW2V5Z2_9BACL|nr:CCA tRNA nucleotidyltransferase [Paenibacillus thermoaerophilus]TMV18677.1 CCA tRNA nucleotidyltransferase [Paenibacillus thermoaerophilus]
MSDANRDQATQSIWSAASGLLARLEEAGHEAYYVGGCVRDRLLGRPVHDIDIATSARPEQVMALFERTVPTGLQHGTVTVLLEGGLSFEVTTFRVESEYADFRRPKSVQFISDLTEDLRRRDFTINAMAMDRSERVIDPFGGERDLRDRVLRCVGDPAERFAEDALRMLRCIRFSCRYGLAVEERTWNAVLEHAPKLAHVAMERVQAELEKTLEGPDPRRGVRLLARSGLPRHMKEPFGVGEQEWQRLAEDQEAVPDLSRLSSPAARWASLWRLLKAGPEEAQTAMTRLRFSRDKLRSVRAVLDFGREVEGLSRLLDARGTEAGRVKWTEAALRWGRSASAAWLEMAALDASLASDDPTPEDSWNRLLSLAPEWTESVRVWSRESLGIDGLSLAREAGRKPGPWLRETLDRLWLEAALGRIGNTPEALLEAFRRMERSAERRLTEGDER